MHKFATNKPKLTKIDQIFRSLSTPARKSLPPLVVTYLVLFLPFKQHDQLAMTSSQSDPQSTSFNAKLKDPKAAIKITKI